MGFRLNRVYVLDFSGTSLDGAEVKIRSTPVSVMLRLRSAATDEELAGLLAENVIDWNLDDEKGEVLPLTADAILGGLERAVLNRICVEWWKAAAGVTAPLDGPSTSGEQSLEQSIPMDSV